MPHPKCQAHTKTGNPCPYHATQGTPWCKRHQPKPTQTTPLTPRQTLEHILQTQHNIYTACTQHTLNNLNQHCGLQPYEQTEHYDSEGNITETKITHRQGLSPTLQLAQQTAKQATATAQVILQLETPTTTLNLIEPAARQAARLARLHPDETPEQIAARMTNL